MHVHLDPVGGVAGDMFVAALVDAWPALADDVERALAALDLPEPVRTEVVAHHDGTLTGRRFDVSTPSTAHPHRTHADIRALLVDARLDDPVRRRALDVFAHLARAEAQVHGVEVADVAFHEVGAWDSVADVVAAAALIETCGATSWSVGSLPLGGGDVASAHGRLPVPSPATAVLLRGFVVHDDGLDGERVTPTGAAILRSIEPRTGRPTTPHRLGTTGLGFGTRQLPDRSNVLRVIELVPQPARPGDVVGEIEFDVDDQTAEDLAVGLGHLRASADVIDVVQRAAFGKKGRIVTEVRVLCRADAIEPVVEQCFRETTTLGVRWAIRSRTVLRRHEESTASGTPVKTAERPGGGRSVKAEMDALAAGDRLAREGRRRRAEDAVLGRGR